MKRGEFWERGQKTVFAREAKISPPYLSDLLARRKMAGAQKARKLVKISMRVCREVIPLEAWLYADEKHPAFK